MSSEEVVCGKGVFTFSWRIENFSHFTQMMETSIISRTFAVQTVGCRFYLILCRIEECQEDHKVVCILNGYLNELRKPYTFDCQFCIFTSNGERLSVHKEENITCAKTITCLISEVLFDYGYPLPKNTLVLHCHLWRSDVGRAETPVHCYSLTRLVVNRKRFLMSIDGFSSLSLQKEKVFTFKSVELDGPTLIFNMSLAGTTDDNAYLQIGIEFKDVKRTKVFTFSMSVMGHEGAKMELMTTQQLLTSDETVNFPHVLSRRELVTNRKKTYLTNDVLTILCEVKHYGVQYNEIGSVVYGQWSSDAAEDIFHNGLHHLLPGEGASHTLQQDIKLLYEDNTLCDFKLNAGGRAFPVHRFLLSARSPVFKKMFESDMSEKDSDTLSLPDLDSDTVDRMLRYIYTDAVPDNIPSEDVARLYYAADKYQLSSLLQWCSALLVERLDISNAVEVLALADRHGDQDLIGMVQDFIFKSGRHALTSDSWLRLEKENPQLALETLRHLYLEKVLASTPEII